MRLFLAVELPSELRKKILGIKINDFIGKKVEEENLHVNIKFFGEVPTPNRIIQKLNEITFEPFKIKLKGFGAFPDEKSPRVIHLKVESPKLLELHSKIEGALKHFDDRAYSPHVTLMRVKEQERPTLLFEEVFEEEFTVNEIALFKSELNKFGPEYEKVYVHKSL